MNTDLYPLTDNSLEKEESVVRSREYVTRKEIFYTSAGRMSISIDSVMDPPNTGDEVAYDGGGHDIIHEETHQVSFSCYLNAYYSISVYFLNGCDLNMVHTVSNVRDKMAFGGGRHYP